MPASTESERMPLTRIDLVVVVRCPLCGAWIVGSSSATHAADVHGFPQEGPHRPADGSVVGPLGSALSRALKDVQRADRLATEMSSDEAALLLAELGRRLSAGQRARLGFLLSPE